MDGAMLAAPTEEQAQPTLSPFIMFHGSVDPAGSPSSSQRFKAMLDANGVPAARTTYDTSGLPPDLQHNLHKTGAFNADMLDQFRTWLSDHGVLSSVISRSGPTVMAPFAPHPASNAAA